MRFLILCFIALLSITAINAQTDASQRVLGIFNSVVATKLTDSTFTATGNWSSWANYPVASVAIGQRYVTQYSLVTPNRVINCEITSVTPVSGNRITLGLKYKGNVNIVSFPSSTGTIYDRSFTGSELMLSDAGSPPVVQSRMINHSLIYLDSLVRALGAAVVDSVVLANNASGLFTPNDIPYATINGRLDRDGILKYISGQVQANSFKANEFFTVPSSMSFPTAPASGINIFSYLGALSFQNSAGRTATFSPTSLTANRVYTLPDANGTLGLLESTQTWTGINTFANTVRYQSSYPLLSMDVTGAGDFAEIEFKNNGVAKGYFWYEKTANNFRYGKGNSQSWRVNLDYDQTSVGFQSGLSKSVFAVNWPSDRAAAAPGVTEVLSLSSGGSDLSGGAESKPLVFKTSGNLLIGTTTDIATAIFQTSSTTKYSLPEPRMTTAQRDALTGLTAGARVFNTTTNRPNYWDGTAWRESIGVASGGLGVGQIGFGNASGNLTGVSGFTYTVPVYPTLTMGTVKIVDDANGRFIEAFNGVTIRGTTNTANNVTVNSNLQTITITAINGTTIKAASNTSLASFTGVNSSPSTAILEFYNQRNDGSKTAVVRTADVAMGAGATPVHLYLYAGKNTTDNNQGNLILNHDGSASRGFLGIGSITPLSFVHVTPNYSSTGDLSGSGYGFRLASATYTNTTTPTATTVSSISLASFDGGTVVSSNAGVTYTNAATLRIASAPVAGAGSSIGNPWALEVASGNTSLGSGVLFIPGQQILYGAQTGSSYLSVRPWSGSVVSTPIQIGGSNTSNSTFVNGSLVLGSRNVYYDGQHTIVGNQNTISSPAVGIILGNSNVTSTNSGLHISIGDIISNTSYTNGQVASIAIGRSINTNGFFGGGLYGADIKYYANYQLAFGANSASTPLWTRDVYFGMGVRNEYNVVNSNNGNGPNITINPSWASDAVDKNGGSLGLNGGLGTGAGVPGDIILSTSTTLSTGSTLQTASPRWYIKGSTGIFSNITSPATTALVDLSSTTQGLLIPRMTTVQRDAISSPAVGLQIYNLTSSAINVWNGSAWEGLLRATTSTFTPGSVLFAGPTGAVSEDNAFFRYTNTGIPTMVLGGLTIRYDGTGTKIEGQPGGSLLIGQSGTGNPSGHQPTTGPYLITLIPTSANGRYQGNAINTVIYGGVISGTTASFTNVTAIGIDAVSSASNLGNYTTNLDGNFLYGPNSSSSSLTSAGLWATNAFPSLMYIGVNPSSHSSFMRNSAIMFIGNKNIRTWSLGAEWNGGQAQNFTLEFPSERLENPNANVTGYARLHAGNHAGVGSGRQLRFAVTFPTTTKASNDPFDTPTDVVTIPGTTIGMGIGTTTPNVSAILDARSTQKGILFPTLTTTERNNILTSVQSLTITNGGSGYTTTGTIVLNSSSGTGVGVTWGITGGGITVANITNGGYNFLPGATATISGGGGTGATVTLNLTPYPDGLSIYNTTAKTHQYWETTSNAWRDFGSYQSNNLTVGSISIPSNIIFQTVANNKMSIPAPVMTNTLRDLMTPVEAGMVYSSSSDEYQFFDAGYNGWVSPVKKGADAFFTDQSIIYSLNSSGQNQVNASGDFKYNPTSGTMSMLAEFSKINMRREPSATDLDAALTVRATENSSDANYYLRLVKGVDGDGVDSVSIHMSDGNLVVEAETKSLDLVAGNGYVSVAGAPFLQNRTQHTGSGSLQLSGRQNVAFISATATYTDITLPGIVTGVPGANQVRVGHELTVVILNSSSMTINAGASTAIYPHGSSTTPVPSVSTTGGTNYAIKFVAADTGKWFILGN